MISKRVRRKQDDPRPYEVPETHPDAEPEDDQHYPEIDFDPRLDR